MRLFVCLVLALLMTGPSAAQDSGTSLDFGGLRCAEFSAQGAEGQIFAAAFMQGFYGEHGGNAAFSMVAARAYAQAIAAGCAADPDGLFIDSAEAAFGAVMAVPADAIAVETSSCQIIELEPEQSGVLFGFLYGYLADGNETALVLDEGMRAWFDRTMDACLADPSGDLLQAATGAMAQ